MFKFILPVTLLIFAASLYISYIGPGFDKIEALNTDIKSINNALDVQKEAIDKKLDTLKRQRDAIDSEDEEKLDRLIPKRSEFDEAGFVNDMNNIAMIEHGMMIDGVQFSNEKDSIIGESGEYGTFKMNFNVKSTYDEFVLLMKDIEQNEQLIDVDIASFQADDEGVYNYQVSLVTYWLK